MTVRIVHGDCLERMRELADASVHSVVTDPPYHLTSDKKGGRGLASVNLDSPHGRARITAGFMGKEWDGGDVAFRPETWVEVMRVLKPGGYLVAFGGTRTYHRMACAIEDAGFEIRDQIGWVYGSGFPKGTDKAKIPPGWQGYNTALKPAWEPIVVARKPMDGTLAANLEAHGCGAMNIDGCRIEAEGRPLRDATVVQGVSANGIYGDGINGSRAIGSTDLGRWPANLVHDGSDEVVGLFPEEAGAAAPVRGTEPAAVGYTGAVNFTGRYGTEAHAFHGDSGSAARFFYCAKADRDDREHGLSAHEKKPLLWSSGEANPGSFQSPNTERSARNNHPTVKPTALMRWLVRLVTPKGGTVLDPFTGSGSTGRAAVLEGFDFIGIESDADYVEIARARIAIVDAADFQLGAA